MVGVEKRGTNNFDWLRTLSTTHPITKPGRTRISSVATFKLPDDFHNHLDECPLGELARRKLYGFHESRRKFAKELKNVSYWLNY